MAGLPQRLLWVLQILMDAHPGLVEPESPSMKSAAHWAWSQKLAMRHIEHGKPIRYSITPAGIEAAKSGGST